MPSFQLHKRLRAIAAEFVAALRAVFSSLWPVGHVTPNARPLGGLRLLYRCHCGAAFGRAYHSRCCGLNARLGPHPRWVAGEKKRRERRTKGSTLAVEPYFGWPVGTAVWPIRRA